MTDGHAIKVEEPDLAKKKVKDTNFAFCSFFANSEWKNRARGENGQQCDL